MAATATRPVPIVLVKCWKVAYWDAKKLLKKIVTNPKRCYLNFKSRYVSFLIFFNIIVNKKLYFPFFTIIVNISQQKELESYL